MNNGARSLLLHLLLGIALLALLGVLAGGGGAVGADPAALQDDAQQGNATRTGGDVVLSVPAETIGDAGNETGLSVSVPAANGSATVRAVREDDRYVARVPVPDVVGENASGDLSSATVIARRDGTVVLEDTADLRYVAQTGRATFRNATLAIPVDARGLGDGATALAGTADGSRYQATVEGVGPDATLLVAPGELSALSVDETAAATVDVGNATVSPAPVRFSIRKAAARGTSMAYRNGDPVVVQPLAHPDVGPARIDLTVTTSGPRGIYHVRTSGPGPAVPVPASVLGASSIRVRVDRGSAAAGDVDGGGPILDVRVRSPSRETVRLRIANGSIQAVNPSELAVYDALLLRDRNVSYVPIESMLRTGGQQPLPASIGPVSREATAILVGDGIRPARVDLTVVPPPAETDSAPDPRDPDSQSFIGLWLDIGSIVSLLFVAMIGSVLSVASVYGLRTLSPARAATAGPRAILAHFVLGGLGGVVSIAIVQALYWGPVLGTASIGGLEIGLGALLVGTFHGGLTATGLRLGLGTVEAWPTRRVIDETAVPVRVRFTDDGDESLPGEQTIEVRRATDGSVVETAALAGTTTEVELPAGEYVVLGRTAEREADPVELTIEEPETPRPETRSVHVTVGRPGLQFEVTDAHTGDPIQAGQVTVTTNRDETRAASIEDGSVATTLPIGTAAVTAVVSAPGYDDATPEVTIEEELTTVDVSLDPASGTLVASAVVDGQPISDATVTVEPAEPAAEDPADSGGAGASGGAGDSEEPGSRGTSSEPASQKPSGEDGSTRDVGVRTGEATTDEEGTASLELPAGRYRVQLVLEGPNADRFRTEPGVATVEADGEASVTVRATFDWEPAERVQRRAAGLRKTIRSVAEEATADPTIPLYFAGVTEALLDCVASLSGSGHQFATSTQDPDEVAAATVSAAEATLEAVGQAMQSEAVRQVMVRSDREPTKISPDLDAGPAELLAYLEQDLTIASVDARAHEVEETIGSEADGLGTVAPARSVLQKAVGLVGDGDPSTHAAAREFAALLLLDAVEQSLLRSEIRSRLE